LDVPDDSYKSTVYTDYGIYSYREPRALEYNSIGLLVVTTSLDALCSNISSDEKATLI